jgi:ABC-type cobalamin/Fe3+-siderophores transport system ATPase subunit
VIDNLSLESTSGLDRGDRGASGAGKTTLVSLLLRFHDPAYGRITLDGRDIVTMANEDVRRMIAVVDQAGWLFDARSGRTSPTATRAPTSPRSGGPPLPRALTGSSPRSRKAMTRSLVTTRRT